MKLTVIIRDDSPFMHLQEPPRHRSVTLYFTPEQRKELKLRSIGRVGGEEFFEEISQCFIED
jgi:hypothetical protein